MKNHGYNYLKSIILFGTVDRRDNVGATLK